MNQGHARAMTPEIERGDGGGILASDDEDVAVEIGMRLAVIMMNLGQVLAGNTQLVGEIVVSGRNDHLAGAVVINAVERSVAVTRKLPSSPVTVFTALILSDVETKVLGDSAVVLERLDARGLLVRGAERDVADFEQFRRGEKRHVRGIVVDGIDQASLVDDHRLEARARASMAQARPVGPAPMTRTSADVSVSPSLFGRGRVSGICWVGPEICLVTKSSSQLEEYAGLGS